MTNRWWAPNLTFGPEEFFWVQAALPITLR